MLLEDPPSLLSRDLDLLRSLPPRSLEVREVCFSLAYSLSLSLDVDRRLESSGLDPDDDVGLAGPCFLWLDAGSLRRPSFPSLFLLSWLFFPLELEADLIRDAHTRLTLIHFNPLF